MIFTQVYGPATGQSARGPWTRWDYKTADGTRHAHFADTQEIPLNVDVALELTPKGAIKSWKATGSENGAGRQQEANGGPQAVRSEMVASQGHQGRDFKAEAEGKTRCALVAQLLPAVFTAQVEAGQEPSPENARVLLDWAFAYVFQTDSVPF